MMMEQIKPEPVIRWMFTSALENSATLQAALPKVRRLALAETIYATSIEQDALDIVLASVSTSPYITKEMFLTAVLEELSKPHEPLQANPELRDLIAVMVIDEEWESLLILVNTNGTQDSF